MHGEVPGERHVDEQFRHVHVFYGCITSSSGLDMF